MKQRRAYTQYPTRSRQDLFGLLDFRQPGYLDLAAEVRKVSPKRCEVPLIGSHDRAETRALPDAPDPGTVAGIRDRTMLCLDYNANPRVLEPVGLAIKSLKMLILAEVRAKPFERRTEASPAECLLRSDIGEGVEQGRESRRRYRRYWREGLQEGARKVEARAGRGVWQL